MTTNARISQNRERQRELYGMPMGDLVRALTVAFEVKQGELAHAIGLSPAMLSQLVSARRVRIGDPGVLARLALLDRYRKTGRVPEDRQAARAMLSAVQTQVPAVPAIPSQRGDSVDVAIGALRCLADPARLAAAARHLDDAFPDVADLLRQAAN